MIQTYIVKRHQKEHGEHGHQHHQSPILRLNLAYQAGAVLIVIQRRIRNIKRIGIRLHRADKILFKCLTGRFDIGKAHIRGIRNTPKQVGIGFELHFFVGSLSLKLAVVHLIIHDRILLAIHITNDHVILVFFLCDTTDIIAVGIGREGQCPKKHLYDKDRNKKTKVLLIIITHAFICALEMNTDIILNLIHGFSLPVSQSKKEEAITNKLPLSRHFCRS